MTKRDGAKNRRADHPRQTGIVGLPGGLPPHEHCALEFHPDLAKNANKNGFVKAGKLGAERMMQAYRSGIFPWQEIVRGSGIYSWWSPDPRMIIMPASLHVSRRLRRKLRSGKFQFTVNHAFAAVVRACARNEDHAETWITPEFAQHYAKLHQSGHAISIEAWANSSLAGGIFGILVGSCMIGESMFSLLPDGSKACLAWLCGHLARWPDALLDCQIPSDHLLRLGGRPIRRDKYLRLLTAAAARPRLQLSS